jgi:uncharacterized protein
MGHQFGKLAFTDRVKALQERAGSRRAYAKQEQGPAFNDRLGEDEAAFIAARDSFYLATVSETGWPYLQHRGGPKGFVRVLDAHTLVFADVRGNKQFISVGNVQGDGRVSMLFMDYPNQARLKLLGRAEVIAVDALPIEQRPVMDARPVERYFRVHVEAIDWNCPQGITPRYTLEEVQALMAEG